MITGGDRQRTPRQRAKAFKRLKVLVKREFMGAFAITLGVFSATFGLNSFLLPNGFIDGGITGVSLLVSAVSGWQLSILIVCLNIPFIVLGYRNIGRGFAIKTGLGILGLAYCVHTVHFPIITHDKLLVAVFGGFSWARGSGLPCGAVV